jgi:putative addiction module component (TIGR02574 family)
MTAEQLITDASSLPITERLRVAQAIWDSLPDDATPPPEPSVKAEFDRRVADYRKNPSSAMSIDELRARLDADRAK